MSAELPSTEQIFTETSRLVPLTPGAASMTTLQSGLKTKTKKWYATATKQIKIERHTRTFSYLLLYYPGNQRFSRTTGN